MPACFYRKHLLRCLATKQKVYSVSINSSIDTILGWCFLFRLFFKVICFPLNLVGSIYEIWLKKYKKSEIKCPLSFEYKTRYDILISRLRNEVSPLSFNPTIVVVRLDEISPLGTNIIFSFLLVMNRDLPKT